jgi:predicted acylesterase/phospholipase RssA
MVRAAAPDKMRIALAIEGGGMRGCVAAGATAALQLLGLSDVIEAMVKSVTSVTQVKVTES